MIHLLFKDAIARILINEKSTPSFPLQQGVKQGCPLASYLFLIVGEILNHNVKREVQCGHIQGITIPGLAEAQTIA